MLATAPGQPTNTDVQSASNSGSDTNGPTTGLGMSTIGVVDLPNPAPPAAPVGTYSVSFAAADQDFITGSGNGGPVFVGGGTGLSRSYVLADSDPNGDDGAFVTETFTLNYTGPTNGSLPFMAANLATPGLTVNATDLTVTIGVGGTQLVAFNGAGDGGSGTITFGATVLNYSVGISATGVTINVTETTAVGPRPGAGTNPDGTAIGVPWPVNYNDGIGIGGAVDDTSQMTTSYVLSISSTPPA